MTEKNDELKKLMEAATEETNLNEDVEVVDEKKKSTKKVIISTVAGLVVFGAILTTGAFMMKGSGEFEDKTKDPEWMSKEKNDEEKVNNELVIDFPVKLPEWAKNPYERTSFWANENVEGKILSAADEIGSFSSSIAWTRSGLPNTSDDPELDGPYTNDVSQRFLSDGETENSDFSYALTEDYKKAYVTYIERLTNPLFGGWSYAQSFGEVNDRTFEQLKDMFTDFWWNENVVNKGDYRNLPIVMDWDKDLFSKYELIEEGLRGIGVFYGVIEETEENSIVVTNTGVDEEGQTIFHIVTPLTYYAYGSDGEASVKISGSLELTLQSNPDSLDEVNRVVISEAKLALDK